jgi:hypothetical protein
MIRPLIIWTLLQKTGSDCIPMNKNKNKNKAKARPSGFYMLQRGQKTCIFRNKKLPEFPFTPHASLSYWSAAQLITRRSHWHLPAKTGDCYKKTTIIKSNQKLPIFLFYHFVGHIAASNWTLTIWRFLILGAFWAMYYPILWHFISSFYVVIFLRLPLEDPNNLELRSNSRGSLGEISE